MLSEQARRSWKVVAYGSSFIGGFYCLLFAEFDIPNNGPLNEHCFTGIRREFRDQVDKHLYGLDKKQIEENKKQQINRRNDS